VAHTAKPVVPPLQGVDAVDANWDTKVEKEILIKPDVKLNSVAFEIDNLKPVPIVVTTPTVK
jgi:hypothetical protein